MHQVTDNNSFSVKPVETKLRVGGVKFEWQASITFFEAPVADKIGRTRHLTPTGRQEYWFTSQGGNERVTISVRAGSPDTALAKLWAVCDETAAWSWNEWVAA